MGKRRADSTTRAPPQRPRESGDTALMDNRRNRVLECTRAHRRGTMRIGVPKEIKNHEYRVGLTPPSVAE